MSLERWDSAISPPALVREDKARRAWRWFRPAVVTVLVAAGAAYLPLGLPVLPDV